MMRIICALGSALVWCHLADALQQPSGHKTSSLKQDPEPPKPICLYGRAVPQFYLLGAQKAGTTTLSVDLIDAGLQSSNGGRCARKSDPDSCRESHFFDGWCKFSAAGKRCGSFEESGKCPPFVNKTKAEDFVLRSTNETCDEMTGVMADMTPINHRMANLPRAMSTLYGDDKDRLMFMMVLREPMARMHSAFYNEVKHGGCEGLTFENVAENALLHLKEVGDNQTISDRDYVVDQFYRSMYSLNLAPWLEEFHPRQFVIIPKAKYFESMESRRSVINEVAKAFDIALDANAIEEEDSRRNHNSHESVGEDLRADLHEQYLQLFEEDRKRLGELLEKGMQDGLTLAGYSGSGEANDIREYLIHNW